MKKLIIIIGLIILVLSGIKEKQITIPKESIRFRIIANSNQKEDQELKKKIVKNLSKELLSLNQNNILDTRNNIIKELPKFTEIVDKTLQEENKGEKFHIHYGKNYFPEKVYKNIVYPSGEYESVVITLGDGKGENFWCVLFPPLCLINDNNTNQIEYQSLIKEIINKYR